MASPLSTFKQMFNLMKRETHHHPEVQHFLSRQPSKPEPEWIDLDEEDHVAKLKELSDDLRRKNSDDREAA